MNIKKTLLALAIAVSVCVSQNINISGIITDTGGEAIGGTVVMLEKYGYKDTTGVNGDFTITGTVGINTHNNQSLPNKFSASIKNNLLYINMEEKSALEIITFNIQGKIISLIRKNVNSGIHSIKIPCTGSGIYLHKTKTGKQELLLKSNLVGNMLFGTVSSIKKSHSTTTSNTARIQEQIDDVIKAKKSGYLNYRVGITNSDTSGIEIKMILCADTVTDEDENLYHAVQLGNQVWTVENLKTTKYNDGTAIPNVTDSAEWGDLTTGAYCYYENTTDAGEQEKWGALYNWYAVNTGRLAPEGWHVPTDAELDTLQNYLIANGYNWDGTTTGNKIAKSMAAKTDWISSSVEGNIGNNMSNNNSSGFSDLPGGSRLNGGHFYGVGIFGSWWSATEYDAAAAYLCDLQCNNDGLSRYHNNKEYGFSVRLVRDLY